MTLLLEQAIDQLSHVPADKQDTIASLILDALADEERWDLAFAKSQDKLAQMANKVRSDIKTGRIKKMGFNVTFYVPTQCHLLCPNTYPPNSNVPNTIDNAPTIKSGG